MKTNYLYKGHTSDKINMQKRFKLDLFKKKIPWYAVYSNLLTHQCTKYSKINVRTIAQRLKLIFPCKLKFRLKFGLRILAYQKKMLSYYWSPNFLCLMKNTRQSGDIIFNLDDCKRSMIYLKCWGLLHSVNI